MIDFPERFSLLSPRVDASAESLIRRFARRYLLVLMAVAALVVVDQALLQPWLMRLNNYAPVINVAGRQRMLSQKLTKAALAMHAATNPDARAMRCAELQTTLTQWTVGHAALIHGDPSLGVTRIATPEITEHLSQLDPQFATMRAAAQTIIDVESREAPADADHIGHIEAASPAVDTLVEQEAIYLPTMDRIVKLLEEDAGRKVAQLRGWSLAISASIVGLLIGLGWFVVRPATRTIRGQIDELEARVAVRTGELSAANLALHEAIAQRERAELKTQSLAARLSHAARISSLGHLTTGLAHELNHPLAAIANYAEASTVLLARAPAADQRLLSHLEQIKRAALRAGQIVRSMRNFVQPQTGSLEEIDLHILVRDVAELCRPELKRNQIRLTLDLPDPATLVRVDPIQIQQVLVNLVQNSIQAMLDCPSVRRRLTIRTRAAAEHIQIDVVDSGPGISADDPQSLFQPFYTTKLDGLGIGLSICRAIVEQHRGKIWTDTASESGATVCFTLPLDRCDHDFRRQQSDCLCR